MPSLIPLPTVTAHDLFRREIDIYRRNRLTFVIEDKNGKKIVSRRMPWDAAYTWAMYDAPYRHKHVSVSVYINRRKYRVYEIVKVKHPRWGYRPELVMALTCGDIVYMHAVETVASFADSEIAQGRGRKAGPLASNGRKR